ncbi:MAG TPA: hypothetical protein VFX22_02525 [Candidatus Kapabacteria bacterium]|nr:hypothetical protein [Candidatus Kapabacteria bacterium]
MTNIRRIDNSDIWAAVRGLGMYAMSKDQLLRLADSHKDNPLFASRVIETAARQVAAGKQS